MGHSSISTTMEYYNQVDDDQRKRAANVIDQLVTSNTTHIESNEVNKFYKVRSLYNVQFNHHTVLETI